MTDANALWSHLIIEELTRNGIQDFCISPGSRNTPLVYAAAHNARANIITHWDERAAAFHALGMAKASQQPVALLCTSGTAVANYLPALIEAAASCVPLIVLTADRPPELLDTGANQAINQTGIFTHYVRWQATLPCPDEKINDTFILTTIDQAVYRATRAPAGPVHINCMFREPLEPETTALPPGRTSVRRVSEATACGGTEGGKAYTKYLLPQSTVPAAALDQIRSSKQGLIVVGSLTSEQEARAVDAFARHLNWPVFPDITSGLRIGTPNPPYVHYYDQLLLSETFRNQCRPDLILQLGAPFVSKRLLQHLRACQPANWMLVANHPYRHDPAHAVTTRIEMPIDAFCSQATEALAPNSISEWCQNFCAASESIHEKLTSVFAENDSLAEPAIAHLVSEHIPADHALFLGNSMPIRNMDMYAAALSPGRTPVRRVSEAAVCGGTEGGNSREGTFSTVFANRGASGIDGNIATAAGYARASGRPLTAIIGDLAALHDLNSLALTAGLPVTLIVINNHGGGIFNHLPIAQHWDGIDHLWTTPHNLSFQQAANMFGLEYHHPTTHAGFLTAYQKATKPILIEITTDPTENTRLQKTLQSL